MFSSHHSLGEYSLMKLEIGAQAKRRYYSCSLGIGDSIRLALSFDYPLCLTP